MIAISVRCATSLNSPLTHIALDRRSSGVSVVVVDPWRSDTSVIQSRFLVHNLKGHKHNHACGDSYSPPLPCTITRKL